jgi:hypothetical protein
VGSWGSSWAAAHRRLGVWGGGVEREGVGQSLQRLPRAPPLLCVQAQEDKENTREREKGGRLGWPLGRFCKEGGERRREEEEMGSLAKIRLNFEKFKIGSKWWWWLAKKWFLNGRSPSTKFHNFWTSGGGVLVMFLFSNNGSKIKEKEILIKCDQTKKSS